MYKLIVRFLLKIHQWAYGQIGQWAIKAEGGLHPKHRLTNYHQFFIDNLWPTDSVLDIGCGNGALSFAMAEKARQVVGIDFSRENLVFARKHYSRSNLEYLEGDATCFPFAQKFDVITLSNVLEHIEHRVEFLKKLKELASQFLIRVPAFDRDWLAPYRKELGLEWRADLTHFTEYTTEGLQKELEAAGLKLKSFQVKFGEIWAVAEKSI